MKKQKDDAHYKRARVIENACVEGVKANQTITGVWQAPEGLFPYFDFLIIEEDGNVVKYECKNDDQAHRTKRVCFETAKYEKGKRVLGGLSITKADYYLQTIYYPKDLFPEAEKATVYRIKVDVVRELLNDKPESGGDDYAGNGNCYIKFIDLPEFFQHAEAWFEIDRIPPPPPKKVRPEALAIVNKILGK
jgi:hypothetical protein